MSILGLTELVYDNKTGEWSIKEQVPKKPPTEPHFHVPPNQRDDPEAVRCDRARGWPEGPPVR